MVNRWSKIYDERMFLYIDLIFRLFGLHPCCDGLVFCNDFQKRLITPRRVAWNASKLLFSYGKAHLGRAPLSHCLFLELKFFCRFDPLVAHAVLLPRRTTLVHLTGFFQGVFAAVVPSAISIIVLSGFKSVSILNVVTPAFVTLERYQTSY